MKKYIFTLLLITSGLLHADNGVYTLNSTCITFGCFMGDSSGLPITIDNPGSYKLTSDIVSANITTNVIKINSDNVTIDLNGFSIIGPRTCTGFGTGLSCSHSGMTADGIASPNKKNVVIKNGIIRGFDTAIALDGSTANSNMVINITAEENEEGILVGGGIITDSHANKNTVGFTSNLVGFEQGSLIIKNSSAFGNKTTSAVAHVCSNVFFINNGTVAGDALCSNYINESVCQTIASCL